MNDQPTINLELSVAEINVILRSLGKHPFDEIATLIAKIKRQGEAQLADIRGVAPTPGNESVE